MKRLPIFILLVLTIAASATAQTASPTDARFKQWDKNGDGKISRAEGNALPYFQAADKNNDGFLTLEEVQNHFRSRRQSGAQEK